MPANICKYFADFSETYVGKHGQRISRRGSDSVFIIHGTKSRWNFRLEHNLDGLLSYAIFCVAYENQSGDIIDTDLTSVSLWTPWSMVSSSSYWSSIHYSSLPLLRDKGAMTNHFTFRWLMDLDAHATWPQNVLSVASDQKVQGVKMSW